ncbi:MAG: hypothetical protein M3463_23435, partial [Verrucomicrobiota bacterium]|nr:hypothetical protein [Verrucomicrobiota bacterium]
CKPRALTNTARAAMRKSTVALLVLVLLTAGAATAAGTPADGGRARKAPADSTAPARDLQRSNDSTIQRFNVSGFA